MGRGAAALREGEGCATVAAVSAHARPTDRVAPAAPTTPHGPGGVEPGARHRTGSGALHPLCARALSIWPGLDRARLSRTRGDPRKLARLVARRTIHSEETILTLLGGA